ncbi:MAG: DUF6843 domain-containing protein [Halobacteriota archaeon]
MKSQRTTSKRIRNIVIAVLLIAAFVLIAYLLLKPQERDPSLYLFPQGYTGPVTIQYGQKDAAPLPMEDGYVVHRIPESGILNTSTSEPLYGVATDKYYYVDAQGKRTELDMMQYIHGGAIGGKYGDPPSLRFFVGSEEQFTKWAEEMDKKGLPIDTTKK